MIDDAILFSPTRDKGDGDDPMKSHKVLFATLVKTYLVIPILQDVGGNYLPFPLLKSVFRKNAWNKAVFPSHSSKV